MLSFEATRRLLRVLPPLNVNLGAYFVTNVLETLAESLGIWNHHMDVTMSVVGGGGVVSVDVVPGSDLGLFVAIFVVAFGL